MPWNADSSPIGSSSGAIPAPNLSWRSAKVRSNEARSRSSLFTNTSRLSPSSPAKPPCGEGLCLDSFDCAHYQDDEVDDRAGGPHLSEEIGISGSVDDVDLHVSDRERGHRERHGKVSLDLFGLEVGDGRAVLDPALSGDRALSGPTGPRPGSSCRLRCGPRGPRCGSATVGG